MHPTDATDRWQLTPELLDKLLEGVPPLSPEQAERVGALLQAGLHPHRPVIRTQGVLNRVDCTCGIKGLATVKPTAGMAPVIKAIQRHRQSV